MHSWGGDQVEEAVAGCVAALRPTVDRDWTEVKAAGLEWNCHETAFHIAEDLIAYAANLAEGNYERHNDEVSPEALRAMEERGRAIQAEKRAQATAARP